MRHGLTLFMMRLVRLIARLVLLMALPASALAAVRVIFGATPIPDGDARAPGDLTVINERLAFAIAVESAVPYGVPRGAIVDVAPIKDGVLERDRVVFADFIPNKWSAWPNSYHRVNVIERGPRRAVVQSVRDWGEVIVTTVYTLEADSDSIQIRTTMHNQGRIALPDLLSGLTLWPRGGFIFPVPGLAGIQQGSGAGALADRVVAYDEHWTVTLHAPYMDYVAHGSLDMFQRHTLAPGETRQFDGVLQVGSSADLAPVLLAEAVRNHLPLGSLSGAITTIAHRAVENPYVVIEKGGHPYGWVRARAGRFEMQLPAGDYELYAIAKGFSRSRQLPVSVTAGSRQTLEFRDLRAPGSIRFRVMNHDTGRPLDARMEIERGERPLLEFLGRKTLFTELDRQGTTEVRIAPGEYDFRVGWGEGFLAPSALAHATVQTGRTVRVDVSLTPSFSPASRGWYCADLHHHADRAEAVTPPQDLARSELAAGLDLLFVSDHDSTANIHSLTQIAARRHVPFIAGIELSPSWGHFNAYPLDPSARLTIDTGSATIDQIVAEARRMGAAVLQVNHPFNPYGYFTSVQSGVAPGGFNPAFDLVEINAVESGDDLRVWQRMWELWSAGKHYYLAGGTDTHDVWNQQSGRVRTCAHIDGPDSAEAFAKSIKEGHAYVTYGPLVYPDVLFGESKTLVATEPWQPGFELQSVAGLKRVQLIGGGSVVGGRTFEGQPQRAHVSFKVPAPDKPWYALMVEDVAGHIAYTDPVWITGID